MDEALDEIYRGKCNVAVKAKEIGVSTEELKRLFRVFAMQRPIDEDVWRGDVELVGPGRKACHHRTATGALRRSM